MKRSHVLISLFLCAMLSTYGQVSWYEQNSGTDKFLTDVFFIDENTGWITGWTGTILHTQDGGNQWTALTPPPLNAYEAIYFIDGQTGWAAGYGGMIIHTTDGGATWSEQESGTDYSVYDLQFINADTGWAISSRYEGFNIDPARRIHGTTDGGETWSLLHGENDEPPLLSLHFPDASNGYAVGETGTILRTTDGGDSWVELMQDFQYHFRDVFFLDADTGFVVGEDLSLDHKAVIFKTTDGGNNWEAQLFDDDQALLGVYFAGSNDGWAVGGAGTEAVILRTEDGGESWDYQDGGSARSLTSVVFADDGYGWAVGYDGTVIATEPTVDITENPVRQDQLPDVRVYPVPFENRTTLEFWMERSGEVTVSVRNHSGTLVYHRSGAQAAGIQQISWNAEGMPPGFYFYQIQADGRLSSGKILKR